MNFIKYLLWLILLSVMAAIYNFSAQPASISDETSIGVTEKIVNILPSVKKMSAEQKHETVNNMHNMIRKYAHFTMFFILGIVLILTLHTSFNFRNLLHLWSVTIVACILYAVFDEVHQLFVEGRSAQMQDIAIDFFGSFLGSGSIMLLLTRSRKRITKRYWRG